MLTFVALGAALAALRAAGEQLGWGFQLQSPAVVSALAILFFVLALNLSGVFEFGQLAPSGVDRLDGEEPHARRVRLRHPRRRRRVAVHGAVHGRGARLRAWPAPTASMLVVFVALGVGMALPYVPLRAGFRDGGGGCPVPGPWLERFKQVLAFPLYATVIWLAWVLGAQRDNDALLRLLIALLGVGFALWAWRIVRTGGARPWGIAGLVALAGGGDDRVAAVRRRARCRRRRRRTRARASDGPRMGAVHAGHGRRRSRRPGGRCSSTSPRRGA